MRATSKFWVNDAIGMPVMMVMGELSKKLQTVIEHQIILRLIEANLISADIMDQQEPQCTLVFDREAYEPAFFQRLGASGHQTAIITTHPHLQTRQVAGRMFARWSQELLYSLSVNRYNQAVAELADLLNQTEIAFPGTELKMIFKISANLYTATSKEF